LSRLPCGEFAALYEQLEPAAPAQRPGEALRLIRRSGSSDGPALSLCSAKRRSACVTGKALREIALAASALPNGVRRLPRPVWADSAETSPCCCPSWRCRSHELIEPADWQSGWGSGCRRIRSAFEVPAQAEAAAQAPGGSAAGPGLPVPTSFVTVLRVVCPQGTGEHGPGALAGLEEAEIAQRLMGGLEPSAEPSAPCSAPLTEAGRAGESALIPSFWPAPSIPGPS